MKNLKILTIIKYLLYCSILTSFITYNFNFDSFFYLKYLTISEAFGIPAVILFLLYGSRNIWIFKQINKVYISAFLLVLSFSIGIFVTSNSKTTLLAIFTLVYLICYSFTIYFVFNTNLKSLLKAVILTMIVLSVVAIYDNLAVTFGYIPIFKNAETIHFTSGFRYFGQLGDYTFTILTFLIPFQFSSLSNNFTKNEYLFLRTATFLGTISLLGSCRISSIVAIIIGIFLWFLVTRNWLVFLKHKIELLLFFIILITSQYTFPNINKNVLNRFKSRISSRVEGTMEADFVIDNFTFAINTFQENPIFGRGLAAVKNPQNDLEIHGTYLKLLGETGIFGMCFYILFLTTSGLLLFKTYKFGGNSIHDFLKNYFPFFVASLIFWSYEYHLRKKEFWIFLALMLIVCSSTKIKIFNKSLPDD